MYDLASGILGIARVTNPAIASTFDAYNAVTNNKKDVDESFINDDDEDIIEGFTDEGAVSMIQYFVGLIIFFAAIYMSFKCNNGFHLGDMLLACCCSTCYLIYRLAVPCRYIRRDFVYRNNFYNTYNDRGRIRRYYR